MSFSQCQEDIFLNENYFHNKKNGTFIELGALDGVVYSNTKFFEDQHGWSGILIEPHKYAFSIMQQTLSSHSSTPEFNRTTTPPSGAPLFSRIVLTIIYSMI